MTTDWKALCAELANALTAHGPMPGAMPLLERARAALDQPEPEGATPAKPVAWMYRGEPDFDGTTWRENWEVTTSHQLAVYEARPGRPVPLVPFAEPTPVAQPEPEGPTDRELLKLMPETMRDEFSYAARVCSDAMAGRVKSGIFRVALNTAALEYAHAVLARWGRPTPQPVSTSGESE